MLRTHCKLGDDEYIIDEDLTKHDFLGYHKVQLRDFLEDGVHTKELKSRIAYDIRAEASDNGILLSLPFSKTLKNLEFF